MAANDPRRKKAAAQRRLVAARKKAGAEREPWLETLRRLREKLPGHDVLNLSLHLPTGEFEAAYSGKLCLASGPGEHAHQLGFLVSFLVPYYVVYSSRIVDDIRHDSDPDKTAFRFSFDWSPGDEKAEESAPRLGVEVPLPVPRREIRSFEFSPDEQPFAVSIAEEIETHWGHERLPPDVGNIVVPDVATNLRLLGEATLYDCLLSDQW
ncbi:MAG: hypothetical protein U0441_22215 [Polyangiaceae bacterium]